MKVRSCSKYFHSWVQLSVLPFMHMLVPCTHRMELITQLMSTAHRLLQSLLISVAPHAASVLGKAGGCQSVLESVRCAAGAFAQPQEPQVSAAFLKLLVSRLFDVFHVITRG